jgi:ADP-heptose:LPS heptosyltransferase
MSFAWMRRIDSWIGRPIIRVLKWFTPRPQSLYGDFQPNQIPKRIVCAKFLGLGSVVLSLPLLKALKDNGVQVAFWSFAGQADLAQFSGYVDEIFVIRPTLKHFLPTLWKSWWAMKKFRPDAFLDLEPTANFTAILSRLSGAAIRVGFMSAKPLRESLFTHLVALTPERHMVINNLWMGMRLGLPKDSDSRLPAPPEKMSEIKENFQMHPSRQYVVININSSDLSWHRMWVDDHWVEVCNGLLQNPNIDLIFPGGKNERARVEKFLSKLNAGTRAMNIAGETTLLQLMKVLMKSKLVVSVDSGIMHIAAWMTVPVVGIFGPETPQLYSPRTSNSRVLWMGLPCSPCLMVAADKITRCQDNQCMKQIMPQTVLDACGSLLKWRPEKKVA